MNHNKQKLAGVFAPVVTPFQGDQPDLDALAFNLTKLRQTDLTGFLALGSNGEIESLTDEERLLVLEVFAQEKGDKVVMVGTGCESTKETTPDGSMITTTVYHTPGGDLRSRHQQTAITSATTSAINFGVASPTVSASEICLTPESTSRSQAATTSSISQASP